MLPRPKPVGETEVLGVWVDVQGSTSRKWKNCHLMPDGLILEPSVSHCAVSV